MIKKNNSFFGFIYNGIQVSKLSESLDDLIAIQDKLFDFGLTMSGFQFVGLVLENSVTNKADHFKVAYFILCLGFVFSLFGSLISYITMKYLLSIKNEEEPFIIEGMNNYYKIFMLSYVVPFCNSILFMVPLNILIYDILDYYFGIIFNVISFGIFIAGVVLHQIVIVNKQEYIQKKENIKIEDVESVTREFELSNVNNSNNNQTNIVKRRISKFIEKK